MTYQKIKEKLVEDKKMLSPRELRKFVLKVTMMELGVVFDLSLLVFSIVNSSLTIIVIFLAILAFNWVFDWVVEDPPILQKIQNYCRFWWIPYILLVAIYLVLAFYGFI